MQFRHRRTTKVVLASYLTASPCNNSFVQMVIELVLGTDMKQHFSTVSMFTSVHRLAANATTPGTTPSAPGPAENHRRVDLVAGK